MFGASKAETDLKNRQFHDPFKKHIPQLFFWDALQNKGLVCYIFSDIYFRILQFWEGRKRGKVGVSNQKGTFFSTLTGIQDDENR